MQREIFFIVFGYLSGSVLYAPLLARLIKHTDIRAVSRDRNPGVANAFTYGGWFCGTISLLCELMKGFLPVWLYLQGRPDPTIFLSLIIAAPVVGHIFPLFHHFHGGKGIAVSFGCLLGLYPFMTPVLMLAAIFLFFSLVVVVSPHYYRTLATYGVLILISPIWIKTTFIRLGAQLISGCILIRLMFSEEKKERGSVRFLWQ